MRDDDRRQDPPVNNGLMISGGTHYVGNQAVGPGAQAISGPVSFQLQDPERTTELLVRVERLLQAHLAELADPASTTRELRRLREELGEPQPQPTVIQRALTRLNDFVQPVTPLVVAVGELTRSVQGLLPPGH
ncbi:hypothetical protein ACIQKE_31515 [Streptomyces griseoviridis]|uniref:Uncharacterized protein n=3 Tax=Streptomyces TaxID=1883 RepID=A0A3S9ZPI4_STRGD|nr:MULTISPECIES: hypothetical protein [Streptomyces]AZS89512.1 hypothetical protein ELQ87_38640 [Streptomyces griseoviridis]MDH6699207.1 hypothetical protein [Streptomyces sp. MAA16]MDT0347846.1 hypothetical protein [Streptomyces sp. DSM 44938]MDT0473752.1 hypothetical protein [Streptomyces sp. DSM 41014]QCN83649.1 hypothetical protein DDJ31_00595 [Streptomyces griseoviridis]